MTIEGICLPRDASGAVDYSVPVLSLGPADSGSPNAPIQWVAGPAGGTLSAGVSIPNGAWKPVSRRTYHTLHHRLAPTSNYVLLCPCVVGVCTPGRSSSVAPCPPPPPCERPRQDPARTCPGAVVTNISTLADFPGGLGTLKAGSLGQVHRPRWEWSRVSRC